MATRGDRPWVVTLSTLLWRRTHPLVVVAVAVTVRTLADVASLFGAGGSALLYTSGAFVWLLLSYSLFRWGAGREAAIGLAIILVSHFFASTVVSTVGEAVVAIPFLLFPPALGASVRYRANSKLREEDQVKLLEREHWRASCTTPSLTMSRPSPFRPRPGAPLLHPGPMSPSASSKS